MAALKEKSANARSTPKTKTESKNTTSKGSEKATSPNTGRKRKSEHIDQENTDAKEPASEPETATPKAKRARKSADGKEQPSKNDGDSAKKTQDDNNKKASGSSKSSAKAAPTKKEQQEAELAKYDVSDIHLDGEEDNAVPIYDTCSDIRTKIKAHQRNAPHQVNSAAALVREFTKCIHGEEGGKPDGLSSRGFNTFMKQTGPCGGAQSPIFYTAYVYFEKLRIKQNKKPSKKRQEMEEHWGKGGMELRDSSVKMWMHKDERIDISKYGKMTIYRMGQVMLK